MMPVSGIAAHEATKRCDARLHLQPPRVAPWRRPMQRASLFIMGIAMREIPLTQDKVALVDDEDFDRVAAHKWCAERIGNTFYACSRIYGKNVRMHRFILGLTDPKIVSDHIDGNGLNNSKANIHATNHSINSFQALKRSNSNIQPMRSKYKGVFPCRDNWQAKVKFHQKQIYIGTYNSEVLAAQARDKKIIELLGIELASIGRILNFRTRQAKFLEGKELAAATILARLKK